jgi:hypothetical protein
MTDTPISTNTIYANNYGSSPVPVPSAMHKGTKVIRKWIDHTVISGEDSDDSVYIQQLDVGDYLCGISLVTDGLGASAGTGSTIAVTVTDEAASPTTTTVAAAGDMDASTNSITSLALAGMHFTPAVGKGRVALVHATGTPVVGKRVKGFIDVMRHSA